jgi:alpha-amylase
LALPGTPFVYYGEEIGMPNGPGDDDRQKRTPMRWRATPDGGFTTGVPWFPPSTGDPAVSVEAQRGEPDSTLEAYRRGIAWRAAYPALGRGAASVVPGLPAALVAVWRVLEGEAPVLVLANLGRGDVAVAAADVAAPEGPWPSAGPPWRPIDGRHAVGDGDGRWVVPAQTLRLLTPAR